MKKIKLWKHLAAVFLCLVLLVQPLTVWAEAYGGAREDVIKTGYTSYVTPGYEGVHDYAAEPDIEGEYVPEAGASSARSAPTFTSETECLNYVRSEMVKRRTTVSFTMKGMYISDPGAWFDKAYDVIMNDNGKRKVYEGDYLRWNTLQVNCSYSYNNYQRWYSFIWQIQYCSTYSQERYVNKKIPSIVAGLSLGGMSSYDKVKACYDYVTKNVTYDYAGLSANSPGCYSCYKAIRYKTAVCQGYATFMYRLLRECKLPCRVIAGIGGGDAHGWNIVKLSGSYYNLDATWDAGRSEYSYFLKNMSDFDGHARYKEYRTTAFHKAYPMASKSYTPPLPKPGTPKLGTAKGQDYNQIKITWTKVPDALGYYIYRKRSDGSWAKIGRVNGSTDYYIDSKVSFGKTYTYTVRAYYNVSGQEVLSNYNALGIKGKTTVLGKPSEILSVVYPGQSVVAVWMKVKGAQGYEIWRQSDLDTEMQYRGDILDSDAINDPEYRYDYGCTDKYVDAARSYTYCVRAYRIYGGKRYYGQPVYTVPQTAAKNAAA